MDDIKNFPINLYFGPAGENIGYVKYCIVDMLSLKKGVTACVVMSHIYMYRCKAFKQIKSLRVHFQTALSTKLRTKNLNSN